MKADLSGLIDLYRQARTDKADARGKVAELTTEVGKHQMAEQRADAVLKHLEPLLHGLDGGSEAMNEVSQELAEKSIDRARKGPSAPTAPALPMASLVESPAKTSPAKTAPARPSPAAEAPK